MGKKLPHTPSSQIRSALRRLWLRSRERHRALRDTGYKCACCGRKQSKAKGHECTLEVHHKSGSAGLAEIEAFIRATLLVPAEQLRPMCPDCHRAAHDGVEDTVAMVDWQTKKSR
jgi:predicted HNH restriction endonuclease